MPSFIETTPAVIPQDPASDAALSAYQGYDHIHWYVGNAKQAASYYVTRFGFKHIAYKGLETGSRLISSHVVGNGQVRFVLTSPLRGPEKQVSTETVDGLNDSLKDIYDHLAKHGDAVKDVAFEVDDVRSLWSKAVQSGAKNVKNPTTISDKDGEITYAVIQTYGETTHTLIERSAYHGTFLPGYRALSTPDPVQAFLPKVPLALIDHCVGNQDWNEMEKMCD